MVKRPAVSGKVGEIAGRFAGLSAGPGTVGLPNLVPWAWAASEAVWAGIRLFSGLYTAPQVARDPLRLHGLVTLPVFAVLGGVALYAAFRRSPRHEQYDAADRSLLVCFVVLNLAALLWGLALGNNKVLAVGDFYRLLVIALTYGAVAATVPDRGGPRLLRAVFAVDVLAAVPRVPTYLCAIATGRFDQRHDPPSLLLFIFPVARLVTATRRRERMLWAAASAVAIAVFLVTLNRTYWVIVLVTLVLVAAVLGVRRVAAAYGALLGALAAIALVAAGPGMKVWPTAAHACGARLAGLRRTTTSGTIDPAAGYDVSVRQRLAEPQWLRQEWGERPTFWVWVLGFGNGAEYRIDPFASSYWAYAGSGFRMHYWHNIVCALLYRMGPVGIAGFVAFFGLHLAKAARLLKSRSAKGDSLETPLVVLASLAAWALLGVTFAGTVLGSWELGIVLGALHVEARKSRAAEACDVDPRGS